MKKTYAPRGKYLWDSWFIKLNKEYHMFNLQAPHPKGSRRLKDNLVSVGHAVSKDLIKWKELPTALKPGKSDEWDNLSLWTGSTIKKGKKYYLFYTGRNKSCPLIQKIGMAISNDLIHWKKHPGNPIITAEKRYYCVENKKDKLNTEPAWRDPYVFKDPKSRKYYMLISAWAKGKTRLFKGCIAIAQSTNLIEWEILPPILSPGTFEEMETPQMIFYKNNYYLFFSSWAKDNKPAWAKRYGSHSGLYCYSSENLFGDYKPVNKNGVVIDNGEEIYDIKLLDNNKNKFTAIGWLNRDKHKKFIGRLSPALVITINKNQILPDSQK